MVEVDVAYREADRLTDPQPGTGQEADEGGEGMRPERPTRAQVVGGTDQRGDLRGGQEVWLGTAKGSHQAAVRDLSVRQHGPEIQEKAPRHTQTLGSPTHPSVGGRGAGPDHSEVGMEGARVGVDRDVVDKAAQEGALDAHLKPESFAQAEVPLEVEMQAPVAHEASPPQ